MRTARDLSAAEALSFGLPSDQLEWAHEVKFGNGVIGVAGRWRNRALPLALLISNASHPLALPQLVIHLLEADPVIYINAPDARWQAYCRRGAGVLIADSRSLGPIFAVTRQRCPFWPGARDPDPYPDERLIWKSRAVPSSLSL